MSAEPTPTTSAMTSVAPVPRDSMGSWDGPLTLAALLVAACLVVVALANRRGRQ